VVDIIKALITVVLAMGIFLVVLTGIYALTNLLPKRQQERGRIAVFLGPALFILTVGLVVPAIRTIWFSLHADRAGAPFTGLSNYKFIFTDSNSLDAIFNSVLWVVVGGFVSTALGLTIARYADGIKGEAAAKSLIFVPGALSLAGAGIIWKFVYDGPPLQVGLLNAVTKAIPGWPNNFGGDGQRLWLVESNYHMNTFLLVVVLIWVQTGFATVVFSAAIKGVPEQLVEAAKVDGATNRQAFYRVTLPYIRPTVVTVVTAGTIAALKSFDIVVATTGGNFRTDTIANAVYKVYFVQNLNGRGSALAVLLFVLVVPVVVINQRSQRRARELMKA
jgi:alpha-glucoside transport system permease protein